MFIAHLPAGYLLTKGIQHSTGNRSPSLLSTGLVASVLPDIDLIYFYLVDHRQSAHHEYLTHDPLAWMAVALAAWLIIWAWNKRQMFLFVSVALANVLLHMVLDSVAADIHWLHPFSDARVNLVRVPARYTWWVWNFVLHWTFLMEILICLAAVVVMSRSPARTTDVANGAFGPRTK